MLRKRIFISIHYLEIGGAETSLIGLLQALDPKLVEVDLFINDHRGEMMHFIPEWVNVIPPIPVYTMIERPMVEVLKRGFFRMFIARLIAKYKYWKYLKYASPEKIINEGSIPHYVADQTVKILPSLLDLGADKDFVYSKMYETDTRRLAILSYCLNNYQITDKGVCYFIFKDEDLTKLNMTVDEGNLYINTFRSLKDVKAVLSVTYDEVHSDYRVSLRSQNLVLYTAAKAFGGGGHDYAAGCHLKTLDDLPKLLEAVGSLK